jgi:polysaccharide biosynthesis/export protein
MNRRSLLGGMAGRARRKERLVLVLVICAFVSPALGAQQSQQQRPISDTELSRDNFSQVAASAAQIKTVLVQDPGFMVELKRWVAREETNEGQIVSESDLTDDAIFQRLETDVKFRSVATALLQRYGYLVPKVNPFSEMAQEQQLLMQERVKWIAQEEAQQREAQAAFTEQMFELARKCAQGDQGSCESQQKQQPLQQLAKPPAETLAPGQGGVENGTPEQNPDELNPPILPPSGAGAGLQRTQLTDEGDEGSSSSSAANGTSSTGSLPLLPGRGGLTGAGESASLLQQGQNGGNAGSGGSSASSGGIGGFGGASGNGMGSSSFSATDALGAEFDQSNFNPFATSQTGQAGGNGAQNYSVGYRATSNRAELQPAELIRQAGPYGDIPSLYDMYMQALPRPTEPKRFGMDVFANNSQNPDFIPMDLPAGPDYVVGPGDGLEIDVWGAVSRRLYRSVDREGRVSLPEVGPVLVSGKSLSDVQQNVQQVLRTQFRDISADVSLARLRTIRVYIVGDVTNPGAYDISSLSTPLNALFVAGGPTQNGSLRNVRVMRGGQLVATVDLYDLLLHGVKSDVQHLENGDSVMVPSVGPEVTVEGMVRRPAIYELKDEKNLSSVLELAGGLLPTATLRHIEVQRTIAHQKQTMLSLDVPASDDDAAATKKLESFQVQDGDRIRVFPIAQGNEDAVYLEGYVLRPGRYSFHDNMHVTDLISSYKDLLPEPALQYAEIIRLNAPDFHPTVESFDLQDALANPSQSPVLHAMDTVRVFSRFDFENPPSVSVLGDVRGPGTYNTPGQIHLADAVQLAGGLAADAQADDAQVFRYLPDGKAKIFSVSLSAALEGDPNDNILLQSRDRVLIHKSANADEPATVYIEGEVVKPGRYPLTTNMTVADLILVGGGLKPSADTQVADVTHYGWSGETQLTGQHDPVLLAAALSGDPKADQALHNGDVVTVRQLPNWNDLGATITLKGEVEHPGTYGIRPGEHLSSVIERAGGFSADAYPYGTILERGEVRQLESKEQDKLILRVKDAEGSLENLPETTPEQKQAKEMALGQYQTTLLELSTNPPVGRVPIRISARIDRWRNTSADIEVRAGDNVFVPKRPDFVMVTGQVFNPTAVSYRPGKSAKWYLEQAGGPTTTANRKAIFVIRADGSVIGQKESLWSGDALGATLQPGDTVVVPEKSIGGGVQWATLFTAASVASSIVTAVFIATHY